MHIYYYQILFDDKVDPLACDVVDVGSLYFFNTKGNDVI